MKPEIMSMWAALNYGDATPLIIALLERENHYWIKQCIAYHQRRFRKFHFAADETARIRSGVIIFEAVKTLGS
jgi:hypothetical protein